VLWCQTNDFVVSELCEMQVIVCMPDTRTHPFNSPFVRDYLGEPVPET